MTFNFAKKIPHPFSTHQQIHKCLDGRNVQYQIFLTTEKHLSQKKSFKQRFILLHSIETT